MSPAPTAAIRRPLLWLHVSTWFWLLLAAFLLFMAVVPGQHGRPAWNAMKIEHGWPLTYAVRDAAPRGTERLWLITEDVIDFHPAALCFDICVSLALLGAMGWALERRARARDALPRRGGRLPWGAALGLACACVVVAVWAFEQSRLLVWEYPTWEQRVSTWGHSVFGDSLWLILPVPLAAWACYRAITSRRAQEQSAQQQSIRMSLKAFVLCAAVLIWICLRHIHVYASWVALLGDLAAFLALGALFRFTWRSWRSWRPPPPVAWRWQFGMKGLLVTATVVPVLLAGVLNYTTLWQRLDRADIFTYEKSYRISLYGFARPIDLLCAKLGLKRQSLESVCLTEARSEEAALAQRSLVAQMPRASTVYFKSYDDADEPLLKQLRELRSAWGLILVGLNQATAKSVAEFHELRWVRCWRWKDDAFPRTMLPSIANCGQLRQLDLYNDRPTDDELATLSRFPCLERVHFTWSATDFPSSDMYCPQFGGGSNTVGADRPSSLTGRITDAGLEHFATLARLEELWLQGTAIRGPGLLHLHGLPRLRRLNLQGSLLDNDGLRFLNGCRNLVLLDLSETEVSSLANLDWSKLPNLRTVVLDGSRFSLHEFQQLKQLRSDVRFDHAFYEGIIGEYGHAYLQHRCIVRPEYLEAVRATPDLKKVTAYGPPMTDDDLSCLDELTSLSELELNGVSFSDQGLVHLTRLKSLQQLSLIDTSVTGAGLRHLQDCNQLSELWLDRTKLDDAGMLHVGRLRGLEKLCLTGSQVTAIGLQHLAGLPVLSELSIDLKMLDSSVVPVLQSLPWLRRVYIYDIGNSAEGDRWAELLRARIRRPDFSVN